MLFCLLLIKPVFTTFKVNIANYSYLSISKQLCAFVLLNATGQRILRNPYVSALAALAITSKTTASNLFIVAKPV